MTEQDVLVSDYMFQTIMDDLHKWKEIKYVNNTPQETIDYNFNQIKAAIEFVNESRGLKGEYTTLNKYYDEVYEEIMSKINTKI